MPPNQTEKPQTTNPALFAATLRGSLRQVENSRVETTGEGLKWREELGRSIKEASFHPVDTELHSRKFTGIVANFLAKQIHKIKHGALEAVATAPRVEKAKIDELMRKNRALIISSGALEAPQSPELDPRAVKYVNTLVRAGINVCLLAEKTTNFKPHPEMEKLVYLSTIRDSVDLRIYEIMRGQGHGEVLITDKAFSIGTAAARAGMKVVLVDPVKPPGDAIMEEYARKILLRKI